MNKVRKICLIIVACVLVIAAGVMVYLTVQSGKSSNSASEVATSKTVSKISIKVQALVLHLYHNHQVAKKAAVMIKAVNLRNQVGAVIKKPNLQAS